MLYYIKMQQQNTPGEKVYLADLAAAMGLKGDRAVQSDGKAAGQGLCGWQTDREAGRTYVELSSKAVELMARNAVS